MRQAWTTSTGAAAAAEAKGQSNASWDLMELSFRFAHRDGPQAMRLIEHIQSRHLEEPGVGEALTQMLIDVGLLRPDGTPAFAPEEPEPAMAAPRSRPPSPADSGPPTAPSPAAAESSGRRSRGSGQLSGSGSHALR